MAKRLSYKEVQWALDASDRARSAAEAVADTLARTVIGAKAQRPNNQGAIRFSADDGITWVEVLACKLTSPPGGFVAVQSSASGYPEFLYLDDWDRHVKSLSFHCKAEYEREDSLLTHFHALLTQIRTEQRRALDALYTKA